MVLERRILVTSSDAMEVLFSHSGNIPGNILKIALSLRWVPS